ncbi:MAG TPA: NYN domain-containing protein [Anaerolineae bacterium]|nr:NYN domain-containing protein [Anaerolineae bacterium]HQI86610.1 NYN domain-containing protein [Anaerolineae bacterium]
MPFLIDGHNVIAALPDIDLEDPDDEAKLVVKLRAWTGRIRRKAIVIFDGGIPGGASRVLSTPEVRVVFAAKYHSTADRIIKERLSDLPDAPNWTVISSDREVLDNARMIGAKTLTAQDFAERLNQSLEVEKEKPEGVSAAEVETWLEVFPEPAPPPAPPAAPAPPEPAKPRGSRPPTPRRPERPAPEVQPVRTTRTIGEQMGIEPTPQRSKPRSVAGKPAEVSAEEVDAWLAVFHDAPESSITPPKPRPQPQAPPPRPKAPAVNKRGGLSADEVETWLEIFGGEPEIPAPPPEKPEPTAGKKKPAPDKSKPSQARLVKRKQQLIPAKDEGKSTLSKEDEELWRRMFGQEDR